MERQIQDLLFPQEFTRLDRIIDLVFATAEDAQDLEVDETVEEVESEISELPKPRANFHAEILPRLEKHFGKPLVKRSRVQWATPDDSLFVSCQVSKTFTTGNTDYWFGLKKTTREALQQHANSYCAFGLGAPDKVVLMPFSKLTPYLDTCFTSPNPEGEILHWHLYFINTDTGVAMLVDRGRTSLDVSEYLLSE